VSEPTELAKRIRRILARELGRPGMHIGGWEPDTLASWLVPGMVRLVKREVEKAKRAKR